jgi:translation initiation factor IF-1
MARKDTIQVKGIVEESLPATTFRVKLEDGRLVLAHLSGKMRLHYIRILPGDTVLLDMTSYDETRGRITRRL